MNSTPARPRFKCTLAIQYPTAGPAVIIATTNAIAISISTPPTPLIGHTPKLNIVE